MSDVALILRRRIVAGTVIECRAFFPENAADQDEIVAEGVGDEVERVEVTVLEIHAVHVFAPGAVYDAADLAPDRRHAAHAARLERRIECGTTKIRRAKRTAGSLHRDNLGMCRRVMP